MPTASGTTSGCSEYTNYNASINSESDCKHIAFAHQVTTDQLSACNPSLSSNLSTCNLQDWYSYCVEQTNATTPYTPSFYQPVNASTIVSGTTSICDCFTAVHAYYNGNYLCEGIESNYSITSVELTTWNNSLTSDCNSNLYAGMAADDIRPVCIGVNAPHGAAQRQRRYPPHHRRLRRRRAALGPNCGNLWLGYAYCVNGPASSTATTLGASPPAPTQSGKASNCDEYYTVASSDSRAQVEMKFNDTFAGLYQWNPAIGDNCQSLWVGYAICVGMSS